MGDNDTAPARPLTPSSKAYWCYIALQLQNKSSTDSVVIKNLVIKWGKLYKDNDPSKEIPISAVEGTVIPPEGEYTIYSCGRESATSGTEGQFELQAQTSGVWVSSVYWSSPYSGANELEVDSMSPALWLAATTTTISQNGGIGNAVVEVVKL